MDVDMQQVNSVMSELTRKVQKGGAHNNSVCLEMFEKHATEFFQKFDSGTKMTTDLHEVAKYTFNAGGKKRLRPLFVFYTGMCVYRDARFIYLALPYACALEMVHTYSLLHDDLPCMDNATQRRGQQASHLVHGEANALLTGNWLLAQAFKQSLTRIMTDERFQDPSFEEYDLLDNSTLPEPEDEDDAKVTPLQRLVTRYKSEDPGEEERLFESHAYIGEQLIEAQAYLISAVHRMMDGQALDKQYSVHKPELTKNEILHLHMLKTGALMQAGALGAGAIAMATDEQQKVLRAFAKHFGIAFQIADDINDFDPQNPHPTNICTHIGKDEAVEEFKVQQASAYKILDAESSFRDLGTEKLRPLLQSIAPTGW